MTWLDPEPLVRLIERDQRRNDATLTSDYDAFTERYGITNRTWARLKGGNGKVRLDTVERVADALDCDLVYALVPRSGLEESVRTQARRRAIAHLGIVGHHARLEDQAVSDPDLEAQIDELTVFFAARRGLWSRPPA